MRAVNLIPAEQRRGAGGLAGRSGGVVYVLPGGLVVLVVLGVVYAFAVHGVADHTTELEGLTQQVTTVNAEASALQPYVDIAAVSAAKVQQVTAIAQTRFNWPTAMAQLAMALPNDVAFTSLSASTGSLVAPGTIVPAGTPGASVTLTACANSQGEVPAILVNLTSVPGVSNVHLSTTVENPGIKYHGLSTTLNSRGSAAANEPADATCPKITVSVSLNYAPTYTVPNSKLPKVTPSAQTVSTAAGSTTIRETAVRRASK